jgi:hypothetical protein
VSKTQAATPLYEEVATHVRRAMHDPDPLERAEAAAWLTYRRLPVSPRAIMLAATIELAV